jgi:LysR family transcriptional regulator, glycine cleavage system transcriptional activator
MVRRLASLNALKAFESASRHSSFSLAAAESNVTHAAISRHIRELEATLGIKLFHRTGRGVELTEQGAAFGREISPAFDILAQATERYAKPRANHQLIISAEVSFAALWLVPRLGRFTSQHSAIELVLDPTNRLVDFSKNEADIGIRFGKGAWRDVEATKLADAELSPVCSPVFLKARRIASPADLARATLLQEEDKEHWCDWLDAAGLGDCPPPSGPTLRGHLALAAAESGQGFALADTIQAVDALMAKRLVRPFNVVVRNQAYYLVRGAKAKKNKAAAAFRDWIEEEIAASFAALKELGAPKQKTIAKPKIMKP